LTTLATDLGSAGPVGFIKMDVEGYETEVLKGAAPLIERDRPVLWIEAHPRLLQLHGSSLEAFVAFLEDRLQYGLQFMLWPLQPQPSTAARVLAHYLPPRARRFSSWRELPANAMPEQVFVLGIPRAREQ
jgi:hypothetical protein